MEISHDPARISQALGWLVSLLKRHGVPYQVVGGLAAQAYGASRPLVDVDMYVPMELAQAALAEMRPYMVREPLPHLSASWDLVYLALNYQGVYIEIGDSGTSPRFFNHVDGRWEPQVIDFAASKTVPLYGVELQVMPRKELIRYKAMLAREVDALDIQEIEDNVGEVIMEKKVLYFEQPGKANTDATLQAARARASELGIRQVVLASSHGYTAKRAKQIFAGLDVELIAVSINAGYADKGWSMSDAERAELTAQDIRVFTSIHALGDDVNDGLGVRSANQVVRETLYTFSQGTKVAVEIALMAADAGLLDMTREIIAIAGSDNGADTALVLRPAYTRKFTDLRIREILAKPR